MSGHPNIGILSFHIFNGPVIPENIACKQQPQYAQDFVGCGALFRTAALREVGGYSAFFAGEFEERELSVPMLKAGWAAYFLPTVLIHHRVSPLQRQAVRSWMRAFRNKLWCQVMHYPAASPPRRGNVDTRSSYVGCSPACPTALSLERPGAILRRAPQGSQASQTDAGPHAAPVRCVALQYCSDG